MSTLKIHKNKEKIVELLNKNIDLEYSLMLKSAISIEDVEINMGSRRNPRMVNGKKMLWHEWFKNEDRPDEKGIRITRNQIIEIEGQKSNGFNKIKYYTIADI